MSSNLKIRIYQTSLKITILFCNNYFLDLFSSKQTNSKRDYYVRFNFNTDVT